MIFQINSDSYIDTDNPIDLSIPLSNDENNPRAWYVELPRFEPVRTEHYVGSVKEGGSVNFRDIYFNPHGHGTHTECLGHITEEVHSINNLLNTYFFNTQVISIQPLKRVQSNGDTDFVISKSQFEVLEISGEALVIRTLPNKEAKKHKNYSSTNPPYFDSDVASFLISRGVKHLLVDLPSVDRESDEGTLAFHHEFWEVPNNPNFERTITELIFVDDSVADGNYIMNLQVAPFHNDAAPSRPVLFEIKKGTKK